jgi:hypothetical protein
LLGELTGTALGIVNRFDFAGFAGGDGLASPIGRCTTARSRHIGNDEGAFAGVDKFKFVGSLYTFFNFSKIVVFGFELDGWLVFGFGLTQSLPKIVLNYLCTDLNLASSFNAPST